MPDLAAIYNFDGWDNPDDYPAWGWDLAEVQDTSDCINPWCIPDSLDWECPACHASAWK